MRSTSSVATTSSSTGPTTSRRAISSMTPACGTHELQALIDYEQFCGVRAAEAEPRAVGGFVEVTPRELQSRLARGEELQLIDVREQFEWDIARIPGARLVPLATLPDVVE